MSIDLELAARRQLLQASVLCRGLSADEVERVAQLAETIELAAGSEIFKQHAPSDALYVVFTGRVELAVDDAHGRRRVLDFLGRGEHFGDMGVLAGIPRTAAAVTVVDSRLLRFNSGPFNELLCSIPGLAANLSRTLVHRLYQETYRHRRRRVPAVIGIVHASPATYTIPLLVARTLAEHGERVVILTDRGDRSPVDSRAEGLTVEQIVSSSSVDEKIQAIQCRLHELLEHHTRVLIELSEPAHDGLLDPLLANCEEVWWLVASGSAEAAFPRLRHHAARPAPWLARTHLVWLLAAGDRFAPATPPDLALAHPSYKVTSEPDNTHNIHSQVRCIRRLVRHLRGTRLGVVLGGGGATGLAHLGVFRALVRAGIDFDAISGTSSGALFGLSYAGGWSPEYAVQEFKRALTPSRWWRAMPLGSKLFLLSKYQRRAWDAMLRPYFEKATYDQLLVPFHTVSTDLVRGTPYVRTTGDVIEGVMESINIPWVAPLILRDGMALVDGAVLNNLPIDLLPKDDVDFVIAVDVASKLHEGFAGNTSTTTTAKMRRASWLQILHRIIEMQLRQLSVLRLGAEDFLIRPDTAGFEFADFSRTHELADIGEAAAAEILPQLQQKLAELDRR